MKILELIPNLNIGGAQTLCVSLCLALAKKPGNNVFLCISGGDIDKKYAQELMGDKNIHLINMHKKRGFSAVFLIRLNSLIAKIKPDVIHTHISMIGYVCLCWNAASIRIFHTVHSLPNKDLPRSMSKLLRARIHNPFWNISLVGISNVIASQCKSFYRTENVIVIFNGIVLQNHQNRSLMDRPNNIVACGNLFSVKRFDLLIKAFFFANIPGSKLFIIGEGVDENNLKELAISLGMQDRIVFTGAVSNPYPFFEESCIFALTSLYEGNPMSILEAMDCGLPVVAPRVGGIPDVVVDGENGVLFDVNETAEHVGDLLKHLSSSKELLCRMSSNNYEKSKIFDMDAVCQQYLSAFSIHKKCV